MPHRSLAEFLEELGRTGELARIDCEVSPQLEAAEITRRVARQQGPALLFRKLRGHDRPLVTNLLGTEARILAALDADSIEAVQQRIDALLQAPGSSGWLDRLRVSSRTGPLAQAMPHKVKSGACQQVVRLGDDVRLDELPQITVAAEEKQSTLAAVIVMFADPDSHEQYAVCCDAQIAAADQLQIGGWSMRDEFVRIFSVYAERKQPMLVAVVLGGDPSVLLAAMAPLCGADPTILAGVVRTKPLDVVACRSIDLLVPAESDVVIEGHIDAAQIESGESECQLSPCLNPAGSLTSAQAGKIMHVTALTHRANAVMTAMVRSAEPNESSVVLRTLAQIFLPATRILIPSLADLDLPLVGGGRYLAIVSINKLHAGQVQRVTALSLSTPPLAAARLMIVVDHDIDVRDFEQVLSAVATRSHPAMDFAHHNASLDPTDPMLADNELASCVTIDATRKLRGESGRRASARAASMPNKIIAQVTARWAEFGLGPET